MQAGFEAASYLGTPLAEPLPSSAAALVRGGLSQQIFDNSLQFPDMSVSERNIVFRRQPPMLQGMNLTRVPTGGFPSTPASIIVGAGVDGVEYNTRMPALFAQPNDPGRRMDIAPAVPLTGENGGETVYRVASDAATRQKRGAMTVRRAEQEAVIARKKQRAGLAKMLGTPTRAASANPPPPPSPAWSSSASSFSFTGPVAPSPNLATVLAEVGTSDGEIETEIEPGPGPCPGTTQTETSSPKDPKTAMGDFFTALQKSATQLHVSTRHLVTGKLSWNMYARRFIEEQHWILAGVVVTTLLVLVILVVVIVMAARQARTTATSTPSAAPV